MKESQILCVAFLYINMLHFQQRVKMQFPSWSIDVVAGSGGPVCRSQCAGAQCAWLGRECTVGRCQMHRLADDQSATSVTCTGVTIIHETSSTTHSHQRILLKFYHRSERAARSRNWHNFKWAPHWPIGWGLKNITACLNINISIS